MSVGRPPAWLGDDGSEMWKMLVAELSEQLQTLDRFALIAACGAYASAIAALKDLLERGVLIESEDRGMVANRSNQIAREQSETFRKWCVELGLTPSARKKLEMELKGDSEQDPVAALRG